MTVFNGERFIKEAVESILNQTFQDFELIIVDNHSQDQTLSILASINDGRMRVIKNEENLGQTKALNIGCREAQAAIIARMDADDIACKDRLAKQWDYLQKNDKIALVGSWCLDIDEEGNSLRVYSSITDPLAVKSSLAVSGDLSSWCISHPTVMMRRDAYEDVGGYRNVEAKYGYPQDYDLWMRFMTKGYLMANLGEVLLKYRILPKSESRDVTNPLAAHRFNITREKVKHFFPDLEEERVLRLCRMLEFLPQENVQDGKKVSEEFDRYFEGYMGADSNHPAARRYQAKLKFYYLPMLFKTDKVFAIKYYFKMLSQHPLFFFDQRFYKKVIKAILTHSLSTENYSNFTNKVLSYR